MSSTLAIVTASAEQDFGRGWAIAMGILIAILALGALLAHFTKPPRRRGRRY